ncbi:MAG TPA: hypothetical protein VE967_09670 [Gemmatimonadaceae bacterium]|nr:hypothetical protein [Gemmatimonadaceae bacterium]
MSASPDDRPASASGRSSPRRKRVASLITVFVVGFVILPLVIVGVIAHSVGPAMVPVYASTMTKVRRAELMRPYVVTRDPSITPMAAGEALYALRARPDASVRPALRPATPAAVTFPPADKALFSESSPWPGPSPTHLIDAAHKGLTRPQLDYLASISANPVWPVYATVARAPRVDIAGGEYKTPLPDDLSPYELPIPPFVRTKEIAYASVSRAALFLANGRAPQADTALRETIATGLHLIDDGNTMIDDLIGAVIVGIGRAGLEELYGATGNPELARLKASTDAFDKAQPASPAASAPPSDLLHMVTDSTLPRGFRYEVAMSLSASVCGSASRLFFGAPRETAEALTRARAQVVRTPAEGELFDLSTHVVDRARPAAAKQVNALGPRLMMAYMRIPAFLLHNSRISNCMAMYMLIGAMS